MFILMHYKQWYLYHKVIHYHNQSIYIVLKYRFNYWAIKYGLIQVLQYNAQQFYQKLIFKKKFSKMVSNILYLKYFQKKKYIF